MLDFSHLPTGWNSTDVQYFVGSGTVAGNSIWTWQKPRGKNHITMILFGKGGKGGNGVVGAVNTAAGGGGGGSGGVTIVSMPLCFLPDVLLLSLAGSEGGAVASYIASAPYAFSQPGPPNVLDTIAVANAGSDGGNATGDTQGSAGTQGSAVTATNMPITWLFAHVLQGAGGGSGGTSGFGPGNTGLGSVGNMVSGGAGGAGLGAAGAAGTAGGSVNASSSVLPINPGGAAPATATTPPGRGSNGYSPRPGMFYAGSGGASTHGSATGAGLVQARGGNGAPGCGGGGSGGALTGSTAGSGGLGGPAAAWLVVY